MILDTHVLIWFFEGDERLGLQARARIESATDVDPVLVSAITPWEIAMLISKDRLALGRPVRQWIEEAFSGDAVDLVPLVPDIAIDSTTLPPGCPKDPSDRIIIATARHLNRPLLTSDRAILEYGASGHVNVIDAKA